MAKDQCVKKDALSFEEFILGFMRYAQTCHGVRDFPRFPGSTWQHFILCVNKELGDLFPQPFDMRFDWDGLNPPLCDRDDIAFALVVAAIIDEDTCRMRLDVDESEWGRDLGEQFPELAENMFQLSQEIDGFIQF